MTSAPRFPAPWDIEEHNRSCFIVRDNNGQALAYVYFGTEPGKRRAANLLTRDEARRIAVNIARCRDGWSYEKPQQAWGLAGASPTVSYARWLEDQPYVPIEAECSARVNRRRSDQ